ncbi:hypothetical protein LTS18_015123, partial [Coniosporium uncinatum]
KALRSLHTILQRTNTESLSSTQYLYSPRTGAQMKSYYCWKVQRRTVWDHGQISPTISVATGIKMKSATITSKHT